jgi:hypothetical protein
LAAKDIIDVQVTVARLDDDRLRPALEAAEFAWRYAIRRDHCPPGMELAAVDLEKRDAVVDRPRRAHVHIRVEDRFNRQYAMLCRDDVDAYYAVKDPVFDVIMVAAREWAATFGWSPGPSDA